MASETKRKIFLIPEEKVDVINLLNKCSRNASEVIVIALSELIEKYNLKNVSSENLKKFVDAYDFIKNFGMLGTEAMLVSVREKRKDETNEVPIPKAESTGRITDEDREKMRDVMANIFSA